MEWKGTNPLFLSVETLTDSLLIDLDEPGWKTRFGEQLAAAGTWRLVLKDGNVTVLTVVSREGDVTRYTSRVFTFMSLGIRFRVYGFLRDRKGDHEEIWWLPWGGYALGEDVGILVSDHAHSVGTGNEPLY